ncbi:MAG: MBL fold metallo-hydrolase [Gemmataceae bacterium]|nr:MBL fold metallo-hydrolase [Gemmataceae bacterium]
MEHREPSEHGVTTPTVTFWGAAGDVTGSMHVLRVGRQDYLLDCGLHHGRSLEARLRNSRFPFHPQQIRAVLLSHAHIDHCGNLPTLVRQGFRGPIYCTPATADLLPIMLSDAARIQEEDAAFQNHARHFVEPLIEPLYTQRDVESTLKHIHPVTYERDMELGPYVRFRFLEAGHILGAAITHLVIHGPRREHHLVFSGDLGRHHLPLLRPTAPLPPADVLICESTYGDRCHPSFAETVERLYQVIRDTVQRGGKVLIPAFSLGRIQLIIHVLQAGLRQGSIPRIPVYVDSPLAQQVAEVYRRHTDCLAPEVAQAVRQGRGLLGGDGVQYVDDFQLSLRLASQPGSAIIIASSGMCDAGRIQHHLKQLIDDPRCSLVLVSYQAEGTLGRRLLEPRPTVTFQGRTWNKWIDIIHLDGFSAHADQKDFEAYLQPMIGKIHRIRLIHGERNQAEVLADRLRQMGFPDVEVPWPGDSVTID